VRSGSNVAASDYGCRVTEWNQIRYDENLDADPDTLPPPGMNIEVMRVLPEPVEVDKDTTVYGMLLVGTSYTYADPNTHILKGGVRENTMSEMVVEVGLPPGDWWRYKE
jgi:hypothetical protein